MWFTKEKICLTSPVFYWKIFLNLIDESHFILIKYLIGSFSFWCYSHILLRRAKWHLPKKYPFFFLNFESCLLWLLAIILTSKNKQQFSICDRRGSKGGGVMTPPTPKKKLSCHLQKLDRDFKASTLLQWKHRNYWETNLSNALGSHRT